MDKIISYKDLIVWKRGIELTQEIYFVTSKFPRNELYGLASQMQRAAVSIPSNIAEGQQRKNLKEYLQFLRIALGSLAELETQTIIAKNVYSKIDYKKIDSLMIETQKMLNVLIKKLESLRF